MDNTDYKMNERQVYIRLRDSEIVLPHWLNKHRSTLSPDSQVMFACEDKVYYANKIVLAVNSPYFRKKLALNAPNPCFLITKTPARILEMILDYLYGIQVQVPGEDWEALMAAAKDYEIFPLVIQAQAQPRQESK